MRARCMLVFTTLAIMARAHAAWTVTVLHPAGSTESYSYATKGATQAGFALVGSHNHGGIWAGSAATWQDLTPSGANASMVTALDGEFQVGQADMSNIPHASLWHGTAASWIDLTPSGSAPAYVYGAFNGVQGGSITALGKQHACIWNGSAAGMVDVHPSGADSSTILGVGGTWQVGVARLASVSHAYLWQGSAASALDLQPTSASSSSASCTDGSKIGGYSIIGDVYHAGYWTGTAASWVDLHPAGVPLSQVNGVSGNYQVGVVMDAFGIGHATIWTGTAASAKDLQAYLPGGWSSSNAYGISVDNGVITVVGTAYNDADQHTEAVMWRLAPTNFSFTLNKSQVAGENSVQGTLMLTQPETVATTITTYDNSSLVTTPATVTVPANATVKNFQITVTAVTSTINTTIYAKLGSITRSQPLALVPLVPTALAFTPSLVSGGQTTSCKVVINGVAGPSGRVVAILDNSSYATVPATVTVPPGASSVTFNITTTHPATQQIVTVTARVSAGEKTGTFRINP